MPFIYDSRTTIQNIPQRSPVVPHGVAYIGGLVDPFKPLLFLLKNNREVTIQAPPLDPMATISPNVSEDDLVMEYHRLYQQYMGIVEYLLSTIDFGTTDMAYLVQDSDGECQIIPGKKALRHLSCPLWMQKIYIDEVTITVWNGGFDGRRGIWKDREVDIFYALNKDLDRFVLNRAMHGLRALEGKNCDLLFEVYGHLVNRDEIVVGLITEAAKGRLVTPDDRDLIRESLQALEDAGCVYSGVRNNHFLVFDGKLRLLKLNCIRPYPDQERRKREAAYYHDWALDELIQELRDYGPTGLGHGPPCRLVTDPYAITYMRLLPPPERPLPTNLTYIPQPVPVALLMMSRYLRGDKYDMSYEGQNNDMLVTRKRLRKSLPLLYNEKDDDTDKQDFLAFKRSAKVVSPYRPTRSTRMWRLSGPVPYKYSRGERGHRALSSTEGIANINEVVNDVVES